MRQTLSLVCLLPPGLTIDHPSDSDIRSKEFSNLKLIKTYLRSSIQQERLNNLAIMSRQNSEVYC